LGGGSIKQKPVGADLRITGGRCNVHYVIHQTNMHGPIKDEGDFLVS